MLIQVKPIIIHAYLLNCLDSKSRCIIHFGCDNTPNVTFEEKKTISIILKKVQNNKRKKYMIIMSKLVIDHCHLIRKSYLVRLTTVIGCLTFIAPSVLLSHKLYNTHIVYCAY